MEFKLNKIDVELRQKVEKTTENNIVHRKEKIKIDEDSQKREKNSRDRFSSLIRKYSKNKKVTIDAIKSNEFNIDGFKDENKKDLNRGNFLDIKR